MSTHYNYLKLRPGQNKTRRTDGRRDVQTPNTKVTVISTSAQADSTGTFDMLLALAI